MSAIIEAIDRELAHLQQVRKILSETEDAVPLKRRGRPPGTKNAKAAAVVAKTIRKLSPEARAKIAAAQNKRWAAAKKAAKLAAKQA